MSWWPVIIYLMITAHRQMIPFRPPHVTVVVKGMTDTPVAQPRSVPPIVVKGRRLVTRL